MCAGIHFKFAIDFCTIGKRNGTNNNVKSSNYMVEVKMANGSLNRILVHCFLFKSFKNLKKIYIYILKKYMRRTKEKLFWMHTVTDKSQNSWIVVCYF